MAIIFGFFAGFFAGIYFAQGWIYLVLIAVFTGLIAAVWGLFRGKDEIDDQSNSQLAAKGIDPYTRGQLFLIRLIWGFIACLASGTVTYGIRL